MYICIYITEQVKDKKEYYYHDTTNHNIINADDNLNFTFEKEIVRLQMDYNYNLLFREFKKSLCIV